MRATILVLLAACRTSTSTPPSGIPVLVDDTQVATLTPADLAARRPLAEVVPVPIAAWRELEADASGNRTMSAMRIDEDVIAYVDHGQPALGLYRRAADLPPKLRALAATPTQSIDGITQIRIRTQPVARDAVADVPVILHAGARTCTLDAGALAAVTPQPQARGRDDRPAWDVRDLAERCFGATPTHVDAGELHADLARLGDGRVVAKLNRRGELVVRVVTPDGEITAQSSAPSIDVTVPR